MGLTLGATPSSNGSGGKVDQGAPGQLAWKVDASGALVPVQVQNWPSSQTVQGTVNVGNLPATQPVSGTVAVSNHPSSVSVSNLPATQPVSGTVGVSNFPATQPVSGSVSVGNFPATQPVSGTVGVSNFPATQAVSGTVALSGAVPDKTAASSSPIGSVSLGSTLGKTNVLKTGQLTTTATTADQVVLTYTVTAGKTLYITSYTVQARLTVLSATATILGTISLEIPSGTKVYTEDRINPTTAETPPTPTTPVEPIPVAAGTVVRFVCTPAAVTSMRWLASFAGYEK